MLVFRGGIRSQSIFGWNEITRVSQLQVVWHLRNFQSWSPPEKDGWMVSQDDEDG